MSKSKSDNSPGGLSRRDFLKGTTAAGAAALVGGFASHVAYAAAGGPLKVGVIGCGGRGTGAAGDCVKAGGPAVQIWAAGDLFKDRLAGVQKNHNIPPERCFDGFDCYKKVLDSGVDMVILASPPGFRPIHFAAAVAAGKHVFMEKPVCVDPWGYREVMKAAEEAEKKKLSVVAGTQRRHQNSYRECIKRIHDGLMGDVVGGAYYWIGGPVTHNREKGQMSDIEWQCRNWYAWSWLSGDHIVEQHVHNIDIMCWVMKGPPEKCIGIGGRQARPEPGNIYDHFAVEYEFPGGIRCASYCSHFNKTSHRVSEFAVGTKGKSNCSGSITGENNWNFQGENPNPYVQEHADLIASITGKGPYWNEGKQVAISTMVAVMGRMSAYTGREISWKWATESSKLKLGPENMHAFGPYTPHPVAKPGEFELI